jgi:uncharacterized membrane protein
MSLTRRSGDSLAVQSGRLTHGGDAARPRIDSIDLLRGFVMIVMALDHTRDFFGAGGLNLRDVAEPALFLTRWVTHFCAPTFIFLAGAAAYLRGARGRSTSELGWFLLTRGMWLILIEFTFVRLAWRFSFDLNAFVFQVIWVIGVSMVFLAGLIRLPRSAVAAIGIGVIAGHNLLDGVHAEQFAAADWIWNFLHQPAVLHERGVVLFPLYSIVPWVGVIALGYAFGPIMLMDRKRRRRWLLALGSGVSIGFVLLRATNLYGDPAPWKIQGDWLATVLSFIDCEKYPPSLLYLMMTLGPMTLALAAFEHARGRVASWIILFGRVPLLYYVAHLYVLHTLAVLYATLRFGNSTWLFGGFPVRRPAHYGLPLPGIYAVWLFVVVALYPACRYFAALKRNRDAWWWGYL